MKQVRDRIARLEAEANRPEAEDIEGASYRITEDTDENRVMILFDAKPEKEIRDIVKRGGFKWSPSRSAWVRMLNNAGRWAAQDVAKALTGAGC